MQEPQPVPPSGKSTDSGRATVILNTGERVRALIHFDGERLHCRSVGGESGISWKEIVEIRFSASAVASLPATVVRLGVGANQHFCGQLLALDGQRLHLQTPWSERLVLERRAVVSVTRPVISVLAVQNHEVADPGQDELWLTAGDQAYGQIISADRDQVAWRTGNQSRRTPWTGLRGLFFQWQAAPEDAARGSHVAVGLAGWDREPDILSGILRSLNSETFTLEHRALGELKLPRRLLSWIRPVFLGTRIELENGWRHLGPRARLEPYLQPPRPAGVAWQRTFVLRRQLPRALVRLRVRGLRGILDGERERHERGELGTALLLNDRRVALLNLLVERTSWTPTELTVALPGEHLRLGDNVLAIRQLSEPKTGEIENVGVGEIVLDAPDE